MDSRFHVARTLTGTGQDGLHSGAYGSRIPRAQSIYDWAPGAGRHGDHREADDGSEEDEDDDYAGLPEGEEADYHEDEYDDGDEPGERPPSYAQIRQHSTAEAGAQDRERSRRRREQLAALVARDGGIQNLGEYISRNETSDLHDQIIRQSGDSSSLATAALLQSVRRHPRFSVRTRNALQDFILGREPPLRRAGGGADPELRDEDSHDQEYHPSLDNNRHQPQSLHPDFQERIHAYTRMHTHDRETPALRGRLQLALSFLERIRFCTREVEIHDAIEAHSLFHLSGDPDFIRHTKSLAPPAYSSWLRPGTSFSGSQHAANSNVALRSLFRHTARSNLEQPLVINGTTVPRPNNAPRASRALSSHDMHDPSAPRKHDHWPVQVTIHSVDYETMTLTGTMEAHNIPDKSQTANIVTYLEGEIVDFNHHTLQTKSFDSSLEKDCEYWRMLAPFKGMNEHECVGKLLSRIWVEEVLLRNHILMRWKGKTALRGFSFSSLSRPETHFSTERCFITPTDSRQGLTISGFYFISLRREDGHIEGLYYDPGSSPYQQLSLSPMTTHQKSGFERTTHTIGEKASALSPEGSSSSRSSRPESNPTSKGAGVQTGGMAWPIYEFR